MTAIVVLSLALGSADGLSAQRRGGRNRFPEANAGLAAITSVKCSFSAVAAGTWEEGQARARADNAASTFTLSITDIDIQEGTGRSSGLGAPAEVTVKLVGANLHILDIRATGALAITTVFSEESRDGRFKAVHSRSDYVNSAVLGSGGPPVVAQYYGDCEAVRK